MRFLLSNSDFQKLKEAHYNLMCEYAYILTYISNLPFFVNSTASEYLNKENDLSLNSFFSNFQSSNFLIKFKTRFDFTWLNISTLLVQKSLVKFFVEYHIHSQITKIKNIYILMEASINDEEKVIPDSRNQKYWLRQAIRECERFNNTSKPINNIYPILISSFPFLGFITILLSLIPLLLSQLLKVYKFDFLKPLGLFLNINTYSGISNILNTTFLLLFCIFFLLILISKSFSYKRSLFITNFKNRSCITCSAVKKVLMSILTSEETPILLIIDKVLSTNMNHTVYAIENKLFSIIREKKNKEWTIDLLADIIVFSMLLFFSFFGLFTIIIVIYFKFAYKEKIVGFELFTIPSAIITSLYIFTNSFKVIGESILRGKNRCNKKTLT